MNLASLTLQEYTAGFNNGTEPKSGPAISPKTTKRRCRTRQQGIALMTVGHAIEYLLDSRLIKQQSTNSAEREALAILLHANVSVYNEGAEIVSVTSRLRQWFRGGSVKTNASSATS